MRYTAYLSLACCCISATLAETSSGSSRLDQPARRSNHGLTKHQNFARQSSRNFISTDDLSVFESTLDAEQEEEERRQLAVVERWYSDDDEATERDDSSQEATEEISEDDEDQDDEDEDNIWDASEPEDGEFKDLYKRGNSKKSSRRKAITTKNKAKKLSMAKKGLIGYRDTSRGPSGATHKITKKSGPNGSQAWLNSGISKSKRTSRWSPPKLKLSQLKTVSLTKALKNPNSPFHACKPWLKHFNSAAKRHNLPPILLASIAMQESSCRPDARGDNGGAFGLMQLIRENCKGRSGSDCSDPEFNINTAAALFSEILANAGGNVLVALGSYNGWYRGMTYKDATRAALGACCHCQQNLDYLQQMLNGWFLNVSPYEHGLGILRNLDICERRKRH